MGLVDNHPHHWPLPLQPLEHRAFRLLWSATLVSNAGSWMQRVATGWLVLSLSNSTAWLGIDAFASGIPAVLLMPLGGVIADRIDRRKLLLAANLAQAVLALILAIAWWSGLLTVWIIVGVSFAAGVVVSMAVPTSQSILPAVVGEDHVPGAVALNSVQYNIARALGPALGGLVMAFAGPGWCFAVNSASFLAVAAVFAVIRDVPHVQHPRRSVLGGLGEGMLFLRRRADLRVLLAIVGLLAFGAAPVVVMLPALATGVLQQGATAYSILLAAFGVGAAAAGIVLSLYPQRQNPQQLILAAAVLVGLCHIVLAWRQSLATAAVLTAVAGMGFVGAMIELGTVLLLRTPDEFRGRVSSAQQIIFRSGQPLGALTAGFLGTLTSVWVVFLGFGSVLVVLVAAIALWRFACSKGAPTLSE